MGTVTGAKKQDAKILFVDDEEDILFIIKGIFHNNDFTILTTTSARQGIDILEREENIRVVFSDYNMPFMDGITFLKDVRKRWPNTVRIMCSGDINSYAIMSAIKDGHIFKFISKPWDDSKLKETIFDAMKRHTHSFCTI